MTIVADTVIHHLSNEKRYVRIRGNRIVAAQYPRFSINDLVGLHRLGRGRGLPVLDTHSRWVRSELKNYLRFLHDLGIGGYRFDSAKHIDPQLFAHVLEGLPRGMNFGELVFQHPADYPSSYWRSMKAYDFPLALAISRAFSYHGDLGSLMNCESLWGPLAVTFVNHHDLARNRRGFANFRLHDLVDRRLAYAYLLSRRDGTPLVYGPDLRYREVKAGLRFHQYCRGLGSHPVAVSPTTLAVKRGETALAAINKAGYAQPVKTSMEPGLYRDLVMGWEGWTDRGKLHWTMPPRSATLLVKVE
jgi:alpha-amylase